LENYFMSNAPIAYPFDPSGTLASNKITAEHQVISPPELSEFHFIIPEATPFFAESMVITLLPGGQTLSEGVDYALSHYFHDASLQCASPIYGSITFLNNQLGGAVRMGYQTLGGDWTLSPERIIEILSNKLVNPRRVFWEQIADLPYRFPPIDHDWHLDDMVGMSEIVDVLEGIRDALIASGEGGLQAHISNVNNPHNTTKAQVGLGSVEDYPVATISEAQAGTAQNRYLTVLRGAQLVQALIGNTLSDHIGNSSNPHNTTKTQVGLGNVDNYLTADATQAAAGTANNLFMTPLRTAQAIAAIIGNTLTSHISNTANPHGTTATQVGLGNVGNYAIADEIAARAGTANNLYMTPAMTREAITAIALQGLADHVGDTNNPHGTTKTQVGLGSVDNYATASQPEAEAGTANNRFMTPARTRQQTLILAVAPLTTHLGDAANPHATTKTQVGLGNVDNFSTANIAQSEAGLASNLFMTPAGTRALVLAMGGGADGLATHLSDTDNPHEVTKTQVGLGSVDNFGTANTAQSEAGVATNLFMTPAGSAALIATLVGNSLSSHIGRTDNPHGTTAAQVGAYTQAQVDTLLTNKLDASDPATDSALLEGYSYEQVIENAKSIDTTFGDLTFGKLPNYLDVAQVNGSLVEWVSVVDTDPDELTAQAIENDLKEDYGSFLPWSAANSNQMYDNLPILDKWGWDAVEQGILLDATVVTGNAMLSAQDYSTNYEFEVEISSTSTASNGAGVIAAYALIDNRPMAISIVRTPGGLTQVVGVPPSFLYKLNTAALHLGQTDAVDLGSANGGLSWSDTDAPNDLRDPVTYVTAGNGWDTSGKVKIKVNRTDNILTIDVTDFGGASYLAGEQIVLDLETVPSLLPFADVPTTWGVISVKQPLVTFKVLNRPGFYRNYVRIDVAADNDKQRLYRHNGAAWEFTYLGINNPLVRPNRLYFSAWDGAMYQSQRNGRLRAMTS
jgi:hypothetical protein